jgi:hypothetical protein
LFLQKKIKFSPDLFDLPVPRKNHLYGFGPDLQNSLKGKLLGKQPPGKKRKFVFGAFPYLFPFGKGILNMAKGFGGKKPVFFFMIFDKKKFHISALKQCIISFGIYAVDPETVHPV